MDAITESPGRYWLISLKYDMIDSTNAHQMQTYYSLIQLIHLLDAMTPSRSPRFQSGTELDGGEFTTDSNVKKETFSVVNDLSDDILLTIFGYCHPTDLIHSFSLVCRRWNHLTNYSIWLTEVRV
ncbi:hypothetical protein LOAG_13848 [Loa loa]|uniref:F-box domain-containing protein n=1 Tax=Loa loa TaxID=7209 RepID=A0A1S0TJ77_LOALO|nr:hypothetical protein LOAG_13848 [Loa loa]EFO14668.1 hypothetical protein LOAG_13848 [Loa loa]